MLEEKKVEAIPQIQQVENKVNEPEFVINAVLKTKDEEIKKLTALNISKDEELKKISELNMKNVQSFNQGAITVMQAHVWLCGFLSRVKTVE